MNIETIKTKMQALSIVKKYYLKKKQIATVNQLEFSDCPLIAKHYSNVIKRAERRIKTVNKKYNEFSVML